MLDSHDNFWFSEKASGQTIQVAIVIAKHEGWNPVKLGCCFVVVLLFYVHGKHLRSCRDGQLT